MRVFIREIIAGALIIILYSSITASSYGQSAIPAANSTQLAPLTLKFDGIDLASFENTESATLERDIYSRVRTAVRTADVNASVEEMKRATQKIIKLLQSEYISQELAKNSKARVIINVDLTFQPLTTAATFQF